MARDVGARNVIMASCAPPIRMPNVYGIDMPSRRELVAHDRTEQEISDYIGADLTIFQTLDDLVASCSQFNPAMTDFDCSVFTGKYITGDVNADYLAALEGLRGDDDVKNKAAAPTAVIATHELLGDVSGGGETAGGGDPSRVIGLDNVGGTSVKASSNVVGNL